MEQLAFAAAVCFALQSAAMKRVRSGGTRQNLLITGCLAGLIGAGFWCCGGFTGFRFSAGTVGMGLLFGGLYVATILCYYLAMQAGPLSYTTFFYSASMLIPALAGIVIWREPFTWQVGAGLVLFLGAFYLISVPGGGGGHAVSKKWMLLCFLSWLGNGCCSLTVKAHQMLLAGRESNELLMVTFPTAAALALLLYAVLRARQGGGGDGGLLRGSAVVLVLAAAGNGLGNAMVAFLSARLDGAYLFPTALGGMLLLVTLYSAFALREKINRAGVCGILAGVAAIVVMNL